MRLLLAVALLAAIGCKKASPEGSAVVLRPTTSSTTSPTKKFIEMGNSEFDKMLADFNVDPKIKKYEREQVTFKMEVESVRELDKQNYLVKGKGNGVNLVCTFMLPPNLPVNDRARNLVPGDKLTYSAEPSEYKSGKPVPTITSYSGGILGIEYARK